MSAAEAWEWFLKNWDTATALVIGVAFAVLGAVGGASDDLVRGATLAVLALIVAALIRLRSDRDSADGKLDRIDGTLTAVEADVAAQESGTPWRIINCELTWDMASRSFAQFTKVRRMHFYRNDVMSLHDWFEADGTSANESCSPGTFLAQPKFKIAGKEYSLISFSSFYKRGDEMTLEIKRELHNSFPAEQNENVNIAVREPTARAQLKVIWPDAKRPTKVWLQGTHMPNQDIDLKLLGKEPDGRASYTYELRAPEMNEDMFIYWNW
jgi:hypothetical protein